MTAGPELLRRDVQSPIVIVICLAGDEECIGPTIYMAKSKVFCPSARTNGRPIQDMRVSPEERGDAGFFERPERLEMRCPGPARHMHHGRAPRQNAFHQGRVTQAPKTMRTGIRRNIFDQLERIALIERNIPSYRNAKARIVHRLRAIMPGKEHLHRDIVTAREALIEGLSL